MNARRIVARKTGEFATTQTTGVEFARVSNHPRGLAQPVFLRRGAEVHMKKIPCTRLLVHAVHLGCCLLLLSFGHLARAADPSPEEILKKADEVRNPAESYFLRMEVQSTDAPDDPMELEVSLQGNTRTLVKTVRPVRDKGRKMLMQDQNMWVFMPNLKRSVRVGLSQRMVGQTANGDITRQRWSGDYSVELESQTAGEWVLGLKASKQGLTYDRLRIWVQKKTFHPIKAEFLTASGKILKRAQYLDYKTLCGRVRPNRIVIADAIKQADQSTLKVLQMEVKTFPSSIFYPENLK